MCGKACRESIDGTTHLVELTNPHRIELGDLKALAAAFGDQSLLVQQMQRVADRLAGDAKSLGKLILPDAVPGRQRTVDNAVEDSTIDLMDQVRRDIERGHRQHHMNSEFRTPK